MKQIPAVTAKSTKEQILQAYQEALDKLEKKPFQKKFKK